MSKSLRRLCFMGKAHVLPIEARGITVHLPESVFHRKTRQPKTQTQNSAYTVIVSLNTRIAVGKTFLWLLLNDIVIIMLPLENMFSLWMPTVQGGIYTSDVSSPPQAVL